MSRYRYVPLAVLAAAFFWAAALGTAQERRPDDRGKGGDTRATKGRTFIGRIVRVDADKGTLVLGVGTDVDRDRGGRPGSGTPGTGTPERRTLERAQRERPGAASERAEDDRGTSMQTFQFGKDVKVSLDGKEATPKDIRAGLFARVTAKAADDRTRPAAGGKTGGDREKAGDQPAGTRPGSDRPGGVTAAGGDRAGGEGRVALAERIEVFTKAPPLDRGDRRGGDRGKDRRSGDRPSDR